MFNFLNSTVLIAATAALIPLLIHLFSKRKVKIVEFSSLKHLKEMQKRQVRKLKIRQLLLLLLRMLIILIAVLAFARPASKGGYIGTHAGVSSVILLDRSASMQREVKDGQLFDLAKIAVADIMSNFGEADKLILIPFDNKCYFPSGERFFSRDIGEEILAGTEVGFEKSDLGLAYNKALELLGQSQNLNRELYIVTDRQFNSLPEQADTAAEIITYFVDLPIETDGNCGLIDIDMGGQLIEVGSAFVIKAEISNHDAFAKNELLASLFIDGIRVMQSEFTIDANGSKVVEFSHMVHNPGWHQGRIELSDDAFLPDNRFYFSFSIPEQFNVLIIDDDNSGGLIKLALVPSENLARYWSVKMVSPNQLAEIKFHEYDAIIFSGVVSLGRSETSRLLKYVDDGGGLLYIAGANLDTAYFNTNFTSILNIRYNNPPPAFFSGAGYFTMEQFDFAHPIFTAFDRFDKDSLPTLRYYALPTLSESRGGRNLAYFSNGLPALTESSYGLGKIILMTAPLNPQYTDLPSHSFFVPMIIRTMTYLAGSVSEYETGLRVGDNIMRTISGQTTNYGIVKMTAPDNQTFNIVGTENTGQLTYDCRPVNIPGIYQLKSRERLVDMFPVNLAAEEGNLSAVDFKRLSESLNIKEYKTIPYSTSSGTIISESRYGKELWKIFLWAVVVIMAVEMFLSREINPDLKKS
ncbi:MAG: BatA domain-containing protein [Candidatus Zixiibacteriota bacterium]